LSLGWFCICFKINCEVVPIVLLRLSHCGTRSSVFLLTYIVTKLKKPSSLWKMSNPHESRVWWHGCSHGPTLIIINILVLFHLITVLFCVFFPLFYPGQSLKGLFIYLIFSKSQSLALLIFSVFFCFTTSFIHYLLKLSLGLFGCSFPNFSKILNSLIFRFFKTHSAVLRLHWKSAWERTVSPSHKFSYAVFSFSSGSTYF